VADDSELTGLDPFDVFDSEAARLARFFAALGALGCRTEPRLAPSARVGVPL